VNNGFRATDGSRPGLHLMEGLWLNVHDLKGLKVLLWETILVTLVILCVTNLIKLSSLSWETLIYPILILVLAAALFLMRGKESH
jgi:hypothetical protein